MITYQIALRIFLVFSLSVFALINTSCEEKDDNKLAKAQKCLDGLRDASPDASAQACQDIVAGLTSPESYVIRCSVGFFLGGVKASTFVTAFDLYGAAATNDKAAVLMGALSQGSTAESTYTVEMCKRSQVPSLDYLASLSQAGTIMTIMGGSTIPATFLANCENGGIGGVCDDAAIGSAVTSMYSVYCIGDAAQTQTCVEINSAINLGGGNPAAVAIALYNLLQ